MIENFIWILFALVAILLLVIGAEGYKALKQKRKYDYIATVKEYVKILVENAEQLGKFNAMTGAEKKMLVMNGLKEIFPEAPEWLLNTAVEAAVLGLDKISEEIGEIFE